MFLDKKYQKEWINFPFDVPFFSLIPQFIKNLSAILKNIHPWSYPVRGWRELWSWVEYIWKLKFFWPSNLKCQQWILRWSDDYPKLKCQALVKLWHNIWTELRTFELWISGLMLDPRFFLISRLNNACSPLVFYLRVN